MPTAAVIDVVELHTLLASERPPVVLDVRWTLAGTDREAFVAGHVPGAIFVDLESELTAPAGIGGRHPLPDASVLDGLFTRAGIHDDTPVVVCGQADLSVAARAWWLLRWAGHAAVSVLDGGFEAWRRAGFGVEIGDRAAPGGGTARAGTGAMPTVDADGAAAAGRSPDALLIDVRAPERYRGEVEPVDPVPGHIPGAVNLPLASLHRHDGRLRDTAELSEMLAGLGDGTVRVASCGSGVNACALVLVGEIVGIPVALYPGSYSGWCALGRPVE